jgi:hypothetical protein
MHEVNLHFLCFFILPLPQEYFLSDYWIEDCRRGMAQRTLLFAAEARSQRGRRQAELYERSIAEYLARRRQFLRDEGAEDEIEDQIHSSTTGTEGFQSSLR